MEGHTWIDNEELAYPHGGFTRHGLAIVTPNLHNPVTLPYGQLRAVRLSIPDTYFTIPARLHHRGRTIRGYVSVDNGEYTFTPEADPTACTQCAENDGCKYSPRGGDL